MGTMEVFVMEAHGLPNQYFFHKMDPYIIMRYKGQERKTSVARGQGGNPKWNEMVRFKARYPSSGGNFKLTFIIMDKDTFTSDDFVGQTWIYVEDILALGVENGTYEMHLTKYRVERMDGTYCGDIKIGVKFISDSQQAKEEENEEEELGGWKESIFG